MKNLFFAFPIAFVFSTARAYESDHYVCTAHFSNNVDLSLVIDSSNRPDLDLNNWDSTKDADSISATFAYTERHGRYSVELLNSDLGSFSVKTSKFVDGHMTQKYEQQDNGKICRSGVAIKGIKLSALIAVHSQLTEKQERSFRELGVNSTPPPVIVDMTCTDDLGLPDGAIECFDQPNSN